MFMLHDIADSTRTQHLRSAFAFTRWSLHNGLTSGTTLSPPSARTLVFHASWRAAASLKTPQIENAMVSTFL
jgi:hypothetical protein